ncbi:MAG: condensation domain-containing protein [Polaribacter sp.]
MISENIENRINALSPKAKKLFLLKVRNAFTQKTTKTSNNKRIVAYIKAGNDFSIDDLKANLKKNLPDYMVPSKFISVAAIPLLPNGKINRDKIQKLETKTSNVKTKTNTIANTIEQKLVNIWEEILGFSPVHKDDNFFEIGGDSILSIQIIAKARKEGLILKANDLFEHQTIEELSNFVQTEITEENSSEEILLKIWEETLGFAPIHKDDNFFEIGGDSILSIQIIAKARKEGLVLKANDLFEHQTIAELSLFVKTENIEKTNEILEGIVPLSPIQHWFFNDHKNAPHFWNQGVKLENLPKISEKQIAEICEYLIKQHDILRASFRESENKWIQEIKSPAQICALKYLDISEIAQENLENEVLKRTQKIQNEFELSKGSLFKCIYFSNNSSKNDFCLLVAHHLVVDAVSWQIIIDDFKNALEEITANKTISKETKTSSFKDWVKYIKRYADNITNEEFSFWKEQITEVPALPIDKESLTIIEEKDISQLHFLFNEEITKNLLEANKAYNTKTEELLIAAFIDTIGNWSSNKEITIGFERHGRETTNSELNVSKTVGWFTCYFPLKFDFKTNNTLDNKIISTKEKVRKTPNGGIGYGALRYLKNSFGNIENPEIVFNFLGTQTNSKSKNAIKTTTLSNNLRSHRSERHYKLEVNLSIIDNVLNGVINFGKNVHKTQTIATLKENFEKQILLIIEHCNQLDKERYTPSDFSDADISQDDLDNLIDFLD